ncbi:MAG: hypothetical protein MUC65_08740, partial [Pontiellaceae bacterium]|nr:hypothetical protein [Pontiellaceae bacterium]
YEYGSNNWTNEANWVYSDKKTPSGVPGPADIARVLHGARAEITTEVVVGSVRLSGDGPGTLIINGGSLTAMLVSDSDFSSACYRAFGSMVVQNKGSAFFYSRFFVGFSNAPSGSLIIHEGSVRVANSYTHNWHYTGSSEVALHTQTIIYKGGLLDVDTLVLNAGVMDIAGGTLIVRFSCPVEQVNDWVANGRMTAMGGSREWKIQATFDSATGWTTIIAVPVVLVG